ncbi:MULTISPECIES: metallophosphoesterase [Halomonas]|uniref:metallophosphoesterase n=1 Tax=Halomonas TaxID=2745 RepID=UPI001C971BFC|nr:MULTISPECIES: metallophosphoesterase [Halomonas]MBY6207481.1 metallophosphoesterase [Halomonas sp. DP3Y7-2]MBY6228290.1 metallophosphoesterase [Halomonas sp. DP3Y7-1]MCA0916355.1 metallophosphoesterase [Halomonas denitrificans]
MFHVYLFIAFLYVLWRVVVPLPLSSTWRVVVALVLLLVSKHHLITQLTTGNMFSPEIPFWAVALLGWGFCAFAILLVMSLALDAALMLRWLLNKILRAKRPARQSLTTVRYVMTTVALTLSGFGVHQAAQVPEVKRVELDIPGLPAGLEGLKVVQLTDLHISRFFQHDWVTEVVARTNALEPDLILITGDLIDGTPTARLHDVAPLKNLRARYGVIASPGNHEYYFGAERWRAVFESLGMQMLENTHISLSIVGQQLVIAGITDESAEDVGLAGPDLSVALHGSPNDAPLILLDHRPSGARQHAEAGVDLQLSGHSHGGMVKGLDLIAAYANEGHVSGFYPIDDMALYVSNGTGLWNGFPIRLGVPGEITELVLGVNSEGSHVKILK